MTTAWRADAALSVLVILIVAMLVVPLPTPLLDVLIATNLGLGALMVLGALYARDGRAMTALPTVLLITTLYRLALNVSSTRLILLQADAGSVIRAFGDFVVRGDYLVGGVIFLILTLIQYVVIARGAERVAEVGARFSLDAMPGKQLAIDGDLRSGTLTAASAQQQRRALERESQLYGAMDGAMKFVKGDAIASIAISVINLVAGAAIGVSSRGLDLVTSLKTYGLLTVGDGLVSQIPALLISTSAAIVVTRVASEKDASSLARDIGDQLFGTPRVLWAVASLLLLLALVPGLPLWPFVVVALVGGGLALMAKRALDRRDAEVIAQAQPRLVLVLEPARHTELAGTPRQVNTLQRAVELAVYERTGVRIGPLAVRHAKTGEPSTLLLDGVPVSLSSGALTPQVLSDALSVHATVLFGVEQAQSWLDSVASSQPSLVRSVVPTPLSLPNLTAVLHRLLDEGVSIRHAPLILESLVTVVAREQDVTVLAKRARVALRRQLSQELAPGGTLEVYQLDPLFHDVLREALVGEGDEERLAVPRELADDIVRAVTDATHQRERPVLLIPDSVRRAAQLLLRHELPKLRVVGASDLRPDVTLNTLAWIGPGL